MRIYIDYGFIWDLLIGIAFAVLLFFGKPILINYFVLPKIDNINNFIISLITVCSTLIGFLLAIITIIVTFKDSFEDEKENEIKNPNINDEIDYPTTTIFDKKIGKEAQFYGTEIYKRVIDVFIYAAIEIGIILLFLLIIQFDIFSLSLFRISIFSLCSLLLLSLTLFRSLYIFNLFLKIHIRDKK